MDEKMVRCFLRRTTQDAYISRIFSDIRPPLKKSAVDTFSSIANQQKASTLGGGSLSKLERKLL